MPMTVSEKAQTRIRNLLHGSPTGHAFLLEVTSGGCSGFQYKFSIGMPADDADISEFDGGRLGVDSVSVALLVGCELDWEEGMLRSGPLVRNPGATSSCGCGLSFSA